MLLFRLSKVEYLELFMRYNGMKENMSLAVSKWKEDLEYVEHYDSENQDNIDIDQIKKY